MLNKTLKNENTKEGEKDMDGQKRPRPQDKREREVGEKRPAPRLTLLYRSLLLALLLFSLVFFATRVVEYNRLRQEADRLEEEIKEHENNAAELRYLIDSPMDDAYIARIARERLGLVFPDEEVFYNNLFEQD